MPQGGTFPSACSSIGIDFYDFSVSIYLLLGNLKYISD